jgi:hypothetical protein
VVLLCHVVWSLGRLVGWWVRLGFGQARVAIVGFGLGKGRDRGGTRKRDASQLLDARCDDHSV